jgi:hypothetical protein
MTEGNGAPKIQMPPQPVVLEIVIRSIGGQIQIGASPMDDVTKLGLLEMAKVALIEQRAQVAAGKGPPLIVPGRFAS